jgi:hypothetical protein
MHVHPKRLSEGIYPAKVGRILRMSRGTPRRKATTAGFTLAELIIAFGLSMMVMAAVLSSYVFIARAYTTIVGFSEPNQPTFEAQGRRTLDVLAADAQVAWGIVTPPTATYPLSASQVTLIVPRATGGTKNVTYYYHSGNAGAVSIGGTSFSLPAKCLVRIDWSSSPAVASTLHTSITSCAFSYFDTFAVVEVVTGTARSYTTYANYLPGIKQLSLALSAQSLSQSGTRNTSREYTVQSPRYVFRNKALLY